MTPTLALRTAATGFLLAMLAACGGGSGSGGDGSAGGGSGVGGAPPVPSLLNANRSYATLGNIDYAVDDAYDAARPLTAGSAAASGNVTLRGMTQFHWGNSESYKGETSVAIDFDTGRASGQVGNFVNPNGRVDGRLSGSGAVVNRSGTLNLDMTLTGQTEFLRGTTRLEIDGPLRIGSNGNVVLWDQYFNGPDGARVTTAIEEGRR